MAEKQNRTKTATLNLRVDPALKAAAERAAAADRRSLTTYVEKLIEDDLEARKPAPAARKR
jgi:predicted HicB family RNase H-like nuclease